MRNSISRKIAALALGAATMLGTAGSPAFAATFALMGPPAGSVPPSGPGTTPTNLLQYSISSFAPVAPMPTRSNRPVELTGTVMLRNSQGQISGTTNAYTAVNVTLDGQGRIVYTNRSGQFTVTMPPLNAGTYTATARVGGATSSTTVTVVDSYAVAAPAPVYDITSFAAGQTGANRPIMLTGAVTENGNPTANVPVTVVLHGQSQQTTTNAAGQFSVTISPLSAGTYTATATAGSNGDTVTSSATITVPAPTVQIIEAPAQGTSPTVPLSASSGPTNGGTSAPSVSVNAGSSTSAASGSGSAALSTGSSTTASSGAGSGSAVAGTGTATAASQSGSSNAAASQPPLGGSPGSSGSASISAGGPAVSTSATDSTSSGSTATNATPGTGTVTAASQSGSSNAAASQSQVSTGGTLGYIPPKIPAGSTTPSGSNTQSTQPTQWANSYGSGAPQAATPTVVGTINTNAGSATPAGPATTTPASPALSAPALQILQGGGTGTFLGDVLSGSVSTQTALQDVSSANISSSTAKVVQAAVEAHATPSAATATALEAAIHAAPNAAPSHAYQILGQTLHQVQPQDPVHVVVNGQQVHFGQYGLQPYISGGRTMIPLRAVGAAMGLNVQWQPHPGEAVMTGTNAQGQSVAITIRPGSTVMTVSTPAGNTTVQMDTSAQIVGGRMAIPIAYVAQQAMGDSVNWYGNGVNLVAIS